MHKILCGKDTTLVFIIILTTETEMCKETDIPEKPFIMHAMRVYHRCYPKA